MDDCEWVIVVVEQYIFYMLLKVNAFDGIIAAGEQEELEELEQSLQALERLDRSSPDLWPDQVAIKHGSSVLSESQWGV